MPLRYYRTYARSVDDLLKAWLESDYKELVVDRKRKLGESILSTLVLAFCKFHKIRMKRIKFPRRVNRMIYLLSKLAYHNKDKIWVVNCDPKTTGFDPLPENLEMHLFMDKVSIDVYHRGFELKFEGEINEESKEQAKALLNFLISSGLKMSTFTTL